MSELIKFAQETTALTQAETALLRRSLGNCAMCPLAQICSKEKCVKTEDPRTYAEQLDDSDTEIVIAKPRPTKPFQKPIEKPLPPPKTLQKPPRPKPNQSPETRPRPPKEPLGIANILLTLLGIDEKRAA